MSSRAFVVDIIHSIGEKTALVDHLEEKLDNENCETLDPLIKRILELRRQQTSLLLEYAENPDPRYWCDFKHAVKAWTQDTEVYEADPNEKTRAQMISSSEVLASITSLFLGMEFETCARCLYDKMLVKQVENSKK